MIRPQASEEPAQGLASREPALSREAAERSSASTLTFLEQFADAIRRQAIAISADSSYDPSLRALMRAAAAEWDGARQ